MTMRDGETLKPFSVPISDALKCDLNRLALKDERKLASYVRKVLSDHVKSARRTGRLPKGEDAAAKV